VFWADDAHQEMLRGKYRFQAAWGLDIFDRTAFLWGHDNTLRQRVHDWLRNRIRLSAYRLERDELRRYLERIARFRPASLYAYSTAAYLLAEEARAAGVSCSSLRLVTLTSEPVYPHIVRAVEGVFGAPAVAEYGSLECGFIASEGRERVLRVREDLVLVETAAREDGRYDILVTVLNNPAFPLVRYALGDVTDAPLERPDRGFAVLRNVAGRDNDLVLSRLGVPLHSNLFDGVFEKMDAVRRWHIRQDATGAVTVLVEPTGNEGRLNCQELEQRIGDIVDGYPVAVRVVSEMPPNPGGKHRWIVSDLVRKDPAECFPPAPCGPRWD
jgi:phenylacetate-CoA ligase